MSGRTSLGTVLVASSKKGIVSILFGNTADELIRDLRKHFPKALLMGADGQYEAQVGRVIGFIEASRIGLDLPSDIRGMIFQQRVWQELQWFPVDERVSCTEIPQRAEFSDGRAIISGMRGEQSRNDDSAE